MQMIETYCYQASKINEYNPKSITIEQAIMQSIVLLTKPTANTWDAAKKEYNERPERGRAFCTLPKHEQVEIVRKYVSREV